LHFSCSVSICLRLVVLTATYQHRHACRPWLLVTTSDLLCGTWSWPGCTFSVPSTLFLTANCGGQHWSIATVQFGNDYVRRPPRVLGRSTIRY